jgi:ABC-type transporter MlaC component
MISSLIFTASLAFATISNPQVVVESIFTKASMPEVASDSLKQSEINSYVDFDSLARAALGKEAKSISAKEFQWFRDTLQEIITRTVYPKAPDFLKDVKISYEAVKEKGANATVISSVQNKADFTDVKYQMMKTNSGDWRVVDVSISGLSWVESIRDQVKDVIKKKKWKGLKEAMNKKLSELKEGKSL